MDYRFLNDFVALVIFWANAYTMQYEFIAVNSQTATYAFCQVVKQQY